MTEKKEQFLKDVTHEVTMLKQHATIVELSELNFDTLQPSNTRRCIYGQLTGVCNSKRAKDLMDSCCIKVMDNITLGTIQGVDIDFPTFKINGEYAGQTWSTSIKFNNMQVKYRMYGYLSALEAYIVTKDAKNEHIIQFLRGEVSELNLFN